MSCLDHLQEWENIGMELLNKGNNTILQNIEEAARLLKEAARQLDEEGLLEMDFEIRIIAQPFRSTIISTTDPGENLPPSK